MKHSITLAILAAVAILAFSGCGSDLHNGTQMDIAVVSIGPLPATDYPAGSELVFSYNMGATWVHGDATAFADPNLRATVGADGYCVWNFSPAVSIKLPKLQALLIDPALSWSSKKITTKISGKSPIGADIIFENDWAGAARPKTLTGVVSGEDVTWTLEE